MDTPIYAGVVAAQRLNPVPTVPDSGRIITTTLEGFVVHDLPVVARRPWVGPEFLDATQNIPIVTLDPL